MCENWQQGSRNRVVFRKGTRGLCCIVFSAASSCVSGTSYMYILIVVLPFYMGLCGSPPSTELGNEKVEESPPAHSDSPGAGHTPALATPPAPASWPAPTARHPATGAARGAAPW